MLLAERPFRVNKCVCEERSEGHEYDPAFDVSEASPINPHVRLLDGPSSSVGLS